MGASLACIVISSVPLRFIVDSSDDLLETDPFKVALTHGLNAAPVETSSARPFQDLMLP